MQIRNNSRNVNAKKAKDKILSYKSCAFPAPLSLTLSSAAKSKIPSLSLGNAEARMPGLERRQHRRSSGSKEKQESVIFYSPDHRHHHHSIKTNGTTTTAALAVSSSAPGSVADRCSFGSDHDALFPHLSISVQGLARRERCSGGPGPDPDPDLASSPPHKNPSSIAKSKEPSQEREETQQFEVETLNTEEDHSFSHALRECQNRRFRSESHSFPKRKQHRRPRPASLDLNGPRIDAVVASSVLSPCFSVGSLDAMKKSSAVTITAATVASSRTKSGNFPIPGTPGYCQPTMGYQKGWSSERVPLPANSSRRYLAGSSNVLHFNNGRTLPSKWEDAEKWIFSPVSGDGGVGRPFVPQPHHRRPKSKSGPLGPPAYFSSAASPLATCFDGGRVGGLSGGSPFLAGVLVTDRGSCDSGSSGRGAGGGGGGRGGARSSSANAEPYILRSASIHGWSDMMMLESSCSLPSSRGDKIENARETGTTVSQAVLRKDVATQMSPEGSTQSSPKGRPSFSPSTTATHAIEELSHFSKLEVRDVEVDDRVTVTRWSKKHMNRGSDRRSTNIIEWKKKTVEAKNSSGWEVAETTKSISKYKREEAKITAWENLQKAKAEASIRKLEMKLEKRRSSSMDKILNKLRSAQRKAQEMRSAATASQTHQVARTSTKRISYFRRTGQISSLSGCFTCHAF